MGWHITSVGKLGNIFKMVAGKLEEKRIIGKTRRRWN
jgi:hypothetical protein